MPEYLSPGVYIEEVSYRARTIEGVSTSTAGFVGPTRYGPVSGEPELVTSLADFQRIYGDLEDLNFADQGNPQVNFLAHSVRAFFEEGGRRLFVQRVFNAPRINRFGVVDGVPTFHYARTDTLAASLAPALLENANRELGAASETIALALAAAAGAAQTLVDAAQASVDAVTAAAVDATAATAAHTAATTAQTAVADADTAAAAIAGAADVPVAITALEDAVAAAITSVGDAQTAATDAQTDIAGAGQPGLDALAADVVTAANALAESVAAVEPLTPSATAIASWGAAANALTDLAAGTGIAAGDVTQTEAQLASARTDLTTAQANQATAQTAFDADPNNQANVDALVAANNALDLAEETTGRAYAAWIAVNSALQIEQIQPGAGELPLRIVARFPGAAGNMRANFVLRAGANVYQARPDQPNPTLNRLRTGSLVHVRRRAAATDPWELDNNTDPDGLMIANLDQDTGVWTLNGDNNGTPTTLTLDGAFRTGLGTDQFEVRSLSIIVSVQRPTAENGIFEADETLGEFVLEPERRNWLINTLTRNPENGFAALTTPLAIELPSEIADPTALDVARNLMAAAGILQLLDEQTIEFRFTLEEGDDGELPIAANYEGAADLVDYSGDVLQMPLNGLLAFKAVEDISIVAAPGYSAAPNEDAQLAIQNTIINHCEAMRYRVAVLDTPPANTVTEALNFRNLRSSDYAAMYYPWVTVSDPRPSQGGSRLLLPPSGLMAGIYARNDTENAVFKAPANEVVRLALDFETKLNGAQQDILNPNGLNCLRFFEGRGFLVWGARTISDDPEWKYISVRRYFAYLERSIDRATQWVVFENNGPDLWGKVRRSVEDFLYNEWVAGGLLGEKPELAYFVRCDRSTMTQNDLDNGRLVCLIGIAPVKPAEFVIFRIGQWTADAAS